MIGSTSWVVPGTYYENAVILQKYVDFIELLVFTWDEETKRLFDSELKHLKKLDTRYSVHLPTDTVENAEKVIEYFASSDFKVLNYVLHPLHGWQKLKKIPGVSVENLIGTLEYSEKMTFDIGHHILGKKFDPAYKTNIVEYHLMGVENSTDHIPLNDFAINTLKDFYLPGRLCCFEVFELEGLLSSLRRWKEHEKDFQ